jgi:hypothetical protein
LQRSGVFWQGGQVDLHGGMMNNAAASLPELFSATKNLLTYQFRPTAHYRCPPLAAFQQRRQLGSSQRNGARARHRPDEVAALQTLGQQAQADAVVPKKLDQASTSASEGKHCAIERVL